MRMCFFPSCSFKREESLFLWYGNPQDTFDFEKNDLFMKHLTLYDVIFIVTFFCVYLFVSPMVSHSIYLLTLSLNGFWLFTKIKSQSSKIWHQ